MKLKNEFIAYDTGNESLLVPAGNAGFSGIVKGNKTFGAIIELLKTDTSEANITAKIKERFDAPDKAVERDVKKVIEELRKIGALNE